MTGTDALLSPAHPALVSALLPSLSNVDPSDHWHGVGSAVLLDHDAASRQASALRRLIELVLEIPDRLFEGDLERYFEAVELPVTLRPYARRGVLRTPVYARPDCILSDGRLQVLEFNISTGSTNLAAGVASRWFLHFSPAHSQALSTLSQEWEFLDWQADQAWARQLTEFGDGGRVGLWYHDNTPAVVRHVQDNCDLLSDAGVDVVPVHTADAAKSDLPLFLGFSQTHLNRPGGGELASQIGAILDGPRHVQARPADIASSSKLNLALLHELDRRGLLDPSDADLVRSHVPETISLRRDLQRTDELRRHKDCWVLKPAISFQASGIRVGRSTAQPEWERALSAAAGVAQRVVSSDSIGLPFCLPDQPRLIEDANVLLMPHFIGGDFAGISLRVAPREVVIGRVDFTTVFSSIALLAAPRVAVAPTAQGGLS